jgi:uncharacterized membrane protein
MRLKDLDDKANRPKIKIRRTTLDWIIEFAAFIFVIILILLPIINYSHLPETIPVHFNAAGEADGYGSKSTLWLLPVTGVFMWLMFTVLESFPQIYNFPVKITPENAVTQYRMATRLLRVLKTVILIIFSFISMKTMDTAGGSASGLGKAFLPVFLILVFGVILVYFVKSVNNKQPER